MNTKIHQVPLVLMDEMMPHLAHHLARGFEHVKMDPIALAEEIRADLTQVWAVFQDNRIVAAFLTSIHTMPDGTKTLDIFGLGGTAAPSWGSLLSDVMADFAKRNGCDRFVFAGRKAWERICKNVQIVGVLENDHMKFERIVA